MPKVQVIFYQEKTGQIPVLDWIEETEKMHPDSSKKFRAFIRRLQDNGHELRRPAAAFLRDGIYELRPTYKRIQYRILYFFNEGNVILCHGLLKRGDNSREFENAIEKTIIRMNQYFENPSNYTYLKELKTQNPRGNYENN